MDSFTFYFITYNFSVVGVLSVFFAPAPMFLKQGCVPYENNPTLYIRYMRTAQLFQIQIKANRTTAVAAAAADSHTEVAVQLLPKP